MGIINEMNLTTELFETGGFFRLSGNQLMHYGPGQPMPSIPFLQETERLRPGLSCHFFEITDLSVQDDKLKVSANISFACQCDDIELQAFVCAENELEKTLCEMDAQGCTDQTFLSYHASALIPKDVDINVVKVAVIAKWKNAEEPQGKAMLLEGLQHDSVQYTHVHPAIQKQYKIFPQPKSSDSNIFDPVGAHNGWSCNRNCISIALCTIAVSKDDLDYLCLYGSDQSGKPRLMVPGQGIIQFQDAFIDTGSVSAVCYLVNLDNSNPQGALVLSASTPEYVNEHFNIDAGPKSISYEMFHAWDQSFQEGPGWIGHHFSYRIVFTYTHQGDRQKHQLCIANHPVGGKYIYQVPDLIIKWDCLIEGTPILMADRSTKMIEAVCAGDTVMTTDGGAAAVRNIWMGHEERYWELTAENGRQIGSTREHPFMTAEGLRTTGSLQGGDYVRQYDPQTEKVSLVMLTKVIERTAQVKVYSLDLEGGMMIANGFICGDFEKQNEM